jgi:hypothetical protein
MNFRHEHLQIIPLFPSNHYCNSPLHILQLCHYIPDIFRKGELIIFSDIFGLGPKKKSRRLKKNVPIGKKSGKYNSLVPHSKTIIIYFQD